MTGLRVGLVCPYSFDRPGGVQNHVLGLAEALRGLGHHPAVLAPGDLPTAGPRARLHLRRAGAAGAVQRFDRAGQLRAGDRRSGQALAPRRWLRPGPPARADHPVDLAAGAALRRGAGGRDLPHRHPTLPDHAGGRRRPAPADREGRRGDRGLRTGPRRRGPSPRARPGGHPERLRPRVLPGRPVPSPLDSIGPWRGGDRPRVTFLGRLDEPRKGLPVLLAALPAIRAALGDVEVCLAGHGTRTPPGRRRCRAAACSAASTSGPSGTLLGRTDVFVAPQVARESFGIVVLEALAAGAEVVASDLPAFVDLLGAGRASAGPAVPARRPGRPRRRRRRRAARGVRRQPRAGRRTLRYDWSRVAPAIDRVYAAVVGGTGDGAWEPGRADRVRRTWTALDDA